MDTDTLVALAPHYLAMLLLAYGAVALFRLAVGEAQFWPELVVIAVVVFGYRPVVIQLGIEPEPWSQ
ncbi:MAG: hypothetical protein V5A23_06625 [Halobacteriales archaeon]